MKTALLFFSLILYTTGFAQLTISGKVVDAKTGEPLFSASVSIPEFKAGTTTDRDGRFTLTTTGSLPITLQINYLGYNQVQVDLTMQDNLSSVRIEMQSIDLNLKGLIQVESHRSQSRSQVVDELGAESISTLNSGKDVPQVLQSLPSVVSTSDAGAGIGYTGLRFRGIDQARINVTLNGIPWNDPESHQVYWVNLPDLLSSTESIQLQRGVGTSTAGPANFGATLDLATTRFSHQPFTEITTGYGSFNTRRINLKSGTGDLGDGWSFSVSASAIQSDGYVDRSESDLKSAYLTLSHRDEVSVFSANVIYGREVTGQAWYGVPESRIRNDKQKMLDYASRNGLSPAETDNLLRSGRTYNYYTYDGQDDRYGQDHYQVLYSRQLTNELTVDLAGFVVLGSGFYEEYKNSQSLSEYGIPDIILSADTIRTTDLIRRRWLDNTFGGLLGSFRYDPDNDQSFVAGGGLSQYDGDHFGEVTWARYASASETGDRYYENEARKTDWNVFGKWKYTTDHFEFFLDGQVRQIRYRFLGYQTDLSRGYVSDELTFFNPKAGIFWRQSASLSGWLFVGQSAKEPTREEYVNSSPQSRPKAEYLRNLESGFTWTMNENWYSTVNLFYMNYKDQLVLTGAVNDVGNYTRTNVPASYRSGVELEFGGQLTTSNQIHANLTLMKSGIETYNEYLFNYDTNTEDRKKYHNKPIAFTPTVTGSFGLNTDLFLLNPFREKTDLQSEIQVKYVGGQYLDNTGSSDRMLDAYTTINWMVRLSESGETWLIEAGVYNLFNQLYESNGYTWGYISGGERVTENFYYPQAGRHWMTRFSWRW
ncbi:MAG: TonB-dependent receptor [Bacteroidetes bacterium]|nr:TonB-dependent receptor [Bacteroidota bacterium]